MVLIDTFTQMPGWAQFLTVWPLPSLIVALNMISVLLKKELHSRHGNTRDGAKSTIWFFSFFWPLFIFIMCLSISWETIEWIAKKLSLNQ